MGFVSIRVNQIVIQLIGMRLGLLETQHIGRFFRDPIQKTLFLNSPDPVDIPTD